MYRTSIVLLLVAGCGEPADPSRVRVDSLAGNEWVHCDAAVTHGSDSFFDRVTVSCRQGAVPAPLQLSNVFVQLDGSQNHQAVITLAGDPGSAELPADALPLRASITMILKGPSARTLDPVRQLVARGTLAADGASLVVQQPFEVWSLTFASSQPVVLSYQAQLSLSGVTDPAGNATFSIDDQEPARDGTAALFVLPVPVGTAGLDFDVQSLDGTHHTMHVTGSGNWSVDPAPAPSTPPPPAPDAAAPPAPDASMPAATDPPPPSPDAGTAPPACGGDGQPACSGSCNSGFVYSFTDGLCHACGRDQQPACGGQTCNDGFVYNFTDGLCHACGRDQQPACGGQTCAGGFVYFTSDGLCHVCGGDGQPACAGQTCNAGLTYSLADGLCHING
jgi:hypothetical protein